MKASYSRVKELLIYNPDTGKFKWRESGLSAGKGSEKRGYVRIGIDGKRYLAHRVAFLYQTGSWPGPQVDHINQDRSDNRWKNLRSSCALENRKNRTKQSNNISGYNGVNWRSCKSKWRAFIKIKGKNIHIGYFETMIDAVAARIRASKYYGFHKNHGAKKINKKWK